MSDFHKFVRRCAFACLLTVAFVSGAVAQSTIFNIPSTDILPEKSFYAELDFISHFDHYRNGGFQSWGYRAVYGVKRKFEVGANYFFTRNGGSRRPMELQPNVKFKIYENEKYGFAASSGALVFVPLTKSAGTRTVAMFYTNASKIVKQTRGTRLTGGFYTIGGAPRDFGAKSGAIVGLEQPLIKKFSFIADWSSGSNRFGYSTAGLSRPLTKRQTLTLGYNFGNTGRGNNGFSAFYGLAF